MHGTENDNENTPAPAVLRMPVIAPAWRTALRFWVLSRLLVIGVAVIGSR